MNKNLRPNFGIIIADFRTFLVVWKSAIFSIFSRPPAEKRLSNAVRCALINLEFARLKLFKNVKEVVPAY
jgi:hypothetical protein